MIVFPRKEPCKTSPPSHAQNTSRKHRSARAVDSVSGTRDITLADSDTAEKWHHKASSMFNDPSTGTTSDATQGTGALAKGALQSRAVFVDRSVLDSMTHLPRDKAARMLGLCSTTFKKVCRRAGMKGWPYRRPLVGNTCEGDAPVTFSRCSPSSSAFHETPHVVATCVPSSP
ncbi:hypothetical protein T484DRAFT_3647584, partial [Baffinella frigidus]